MLRLFYNWNNVLQNKIIQKNYLVCDGDNVFHFRVAMPKVSSENLNSRVFFSYLIASFRPDATQPFSQDTILQRDASMKKYSWLYSS